MDSLFNPHAGQERDRRSQIGSPRRVGHFSRKGFPTASVAYHGLEDNSATHTPKPQGCRSTAREREGHSLKSAAELSPVESDAERRDAILIPRGREGSGKRIWRINALEAQT
jgi:hypothetical protein